MNTYNINDINFINSNLYKEFIKNNPSIGYLRIRAYSASEAFPIKGLKVVITANYQNNNIIFYEGETDASGLIDRISLPAPKIAADNLNVPNALPYSIRATYSKENLDATYIVEMYEGICVVQNINVAPKTIEAGVFTWQ